MPPATAHDRSSDAGAPRTNTRALALRRIRACGALLSAPNRTLVGGDGMHVGTPKEVPRRAVTRMCTCVDGHGWGDYAMGLDDPLLAGRALSSLGRQQLEQDGEQRRHDAR